MGDPLTSNIMHNKGTRELNYSRQRVLKDERTTNWRTQKRCAASHRIIYWDTCHPGDTTIFITPGDTKEWRYCSRKPVGRNRLTTSGRRGFRGLKVEGEADDSEEYLTGNEDVTEVWEEYILDAEENIKAKAERAEVDLGKIMRLGRTRKPKAGDFEVVPSLRSVVALDDRFTADSPMTLEEYDEPWEYVDDEMEGGKAPSYADLLR